MLRLKPAALLLASAALFGAPAVASEHDGEWHPKEGWYFYLGGGGTVLFGSDVDWNVGGNEYNGSLNDDWGGAVEGGFGYDFGEWSTDLVYKYRWFDNDDFSFNSNRVGSNLTNVSVGDSDWQTLLLGIYKDFQAKDSKFFFKLGPVGGLGCYNSPDVTAKYTFLKNDLTRSRKVKVKVNGDNECSFTWGGKAGLGYEIDKNWDVTFDVMWVSQTGGATTSGSKKKRVSYSITEPQTVPGNPIYNPNNQYVPPGGSVSQPCGANPVASSPALQASSCYDASITERMVTETVIRDINVNSLRYTPTQGLNLMLGLRYTFGSKPKADPKVVVEEVMIEEEVQKPAVRGLW